MITMIGLLIGHLVERRERRRVAEEVEACEWGEFWDSVAAVFEEDQGELDEVGLRRAMREHPAGKGRRS